MAAFFILNVHNSILQARCAVSKGIGREYATAGAKVETDQLLKRS